MIDHKKEILKIIERLSYSKQPEGVFRDWCCMFAVSMQNSCRILHDERWERAERKYTDCAKKYSRDEMSMMSDMCAHLVDLFERDMFRDHLGSIYMETFGGNRNMGQCFTPGNLCDAMARVTVRMQGDDCGPVRISDPACGGGATLIAACGEMHAQGFDYQRMCVIDASDLDELCVNMCYVQLSLIGARGYVRHMDSLSGRHFETYETPMMCIGPL